MSPAPIARIFKAGIAGETDGAGGAGSVAGNVAVMPGPGPQMEGSSSATSTGLIAAVVVNLH